MASVHSEEEQQFLVGLDVGSDFGIGWLGGLRDPANHSNWLWSDGTPWDYSNWALGEPNDGLQGLEDCAHMWESGHLPLAERHRWNDRPCSHLRTFVCKKGRKTLDTENQNTFSVFILSLPPYFFLFSFNTTFYKN